MTRPQYKCPVSARSSAGVDAKCTCLIFIPPSGTLLRTSLTPPPVLSCTPDRQLAIPKTHSLPHSATRLISFIASLAYLAALCPFRKNVNRNGTLLLCTLTFLFAYPTANKSLVIPQSNLTTPSLLFLSLTISFFSPPNCSLRTPLSVSSVCLFFFPLQLSAYHGMMVSD